MPTYGVGLAVLLVSTLSPAPAVSQVRYDTEVGRDVAAGGLVLTALLLRELVLAPEDVGPADFDRTFQGPGFDAVATRAHSPTWRAWTDRLVYGLMASAIGAAVLPRLTGDGQLGPNATMLGETMLLTVGTTEVLKRTFDRHRPYTYNTELDDETIALLVGSDSADARASFPSGHSSMAFASATFTASVLTSTYSWPTGVDAGVWAITLGAASATAIGRVKAGKHFPSDVLVGALIGGAIGLLVPTCHEVGSGFCDLNRMESATPAFNVSLVSIPIG